MLCGITCQHTVQNRPQQNGVAEQANQLLSDRITAMMNKSGMPKIFWGECLAALVHTWNRSPSKTMGGTTSYQLWYRKSQMCLISKSGDVRPMYTHRKDKCSSLSPHMERCAFIGYPEGIKGWKFIIPKTRHTIVSERTEFDERHFLYKLVDQDQTVPQTSTQLFEHEEEAATIKQLEDITHQTPNRTKMHPKSKNWTMK